MKTYEIIFQRENGTKGTDRFMAATEAQARRDFAECYRHGDVEIESVTEISQNTPATKEQERQALAKIRKIVEELGESSYIGMAFEGCFEIAEENIENDFGCSMKQRAEKAERDAEEFRRAANYESGELAKSETENEKLKKELAESKKRELSRELHTSIYSFVTNIKEETDKDIMNTAKMAATFIRGSDASNNALDSLEELFKEKRELEKIIAGLGQIDYCE